MKSLFSSLRFRLILVVLLATVPVLVLTIFSDIEQREDATLRVQEESLRAAQFAASKNEILIEDTRVLLVSLSHAAYYSGEQLNQCGDIFAHLKDIHFPFYSAFYVADLQGNVLCNIPGGDLPADLPGCPHYQKLIQSDDFVVSEYHICRNTGKGVISMGYPIFDDDTNRVGVINIGINLSWFNEFAAEARLPEESNLTVLDRNGVVLAHYPDPENWVGKTLPENDLHEMMISQKSGTATGKMIDEVERLYAFMPLSGSEESVFVTIGIPLDVAFADVNKALRRDILTIGGVTALALIAAWLLGDFFITKPTRILMETTHKIAAGDLQTRTNMKYDQGEFGQLAQAIDHMATATEQRKKERDTAELAMQAYARELERSNRDLLDFANIASHDMQEPLRKIQTFGDLLLSRYENSLDQEGVDYLNRMTLAAKRMQEIINDLMAYSRISSQANPAEEIDLTAVIRETLAELDLSIEETNASIEVQNLPKLFADPQQMQRLFFNLIQNAIKFHRADQPPKIQIFSPSLASTAAAQKRATKPSSHEIWVVDNGIGFNPEYAGRIFQPFERLHAQNKYSGTGMGLAICRKIVERHGGTITAKSVSGEGATFILKFPQKTVSGAHHE